MVIVFVLVALLVLAAFGLLHWYAWRRLVRDTTRGPGLARRVGAGVFIAGPVLLFAAFGAERGGAPFWLQQTLGWPGFLWLAFSLYLLLALLAGEVVRPLLIRLPARRAPAPAERPEPAVRAPEPVPAGEAHGPGRRHRRVAGDHRRDHGHRHDHDPRPGLRRRHRT
jgi:uncharacterized protein